MFEDTFASFSQLLAKWVGWDLTVKGVLHTLHQIKKVDFIGLVKGTHQITLKENKKVLRESAGAFVGGILRKTGARIKVTPSSQKKIGEIFTQGYFWRDPNVDLVEDSPDMEGSENAQHFDLESSSTFLEAARALTGANKDATEEEITTLLKEQGHTFSAEQVDELKKEFVVGEELIGLLTNGYPNFFFVENTEGEISVFNLRWDSDVWYVNRDLLADSFRWRVGVRFFFRNGEREKK